MKYNSYHPSKWRTYQSKLRGIERQKRLMKKLPFLVVISGCAFAVLALIFVIGTWTAGHLQQENPTPTPEKKNDAVPAKTSPENLLNHLSTAAKDSLIFEDQFVLEKDGHRFIINTTIHTKLRDYIEKLLQRSRSLQAAVVVLNPYDGRVLAMVSYDSNGNPENLCLKADYPAASLFKIVSAAAAFEKVGFDPDKTFFYNGSRHTLYKNQLKKTRNRYSSSTQFRKAFARSNNPVFGKVGIYALGRAVIAEYAEKFFFNRPIPFDLPVAVSTIGVPDDDFGIAEIASGFNKRTLISPLHAALIASALADNGKITQPRLVEKICTESGEILYQAGQSTLGAAIKRKTASNLKILMKDAIVYGTARRAFGKLRRQRRFKDFDMGAKTGTINDRTDTFKYDWLTGYALSPAGTRGICVAVVSVHGEILGTRSTELARAIIDYYFKSK